MVNAGRQEDPTGADVAGLRTDSRRGGKGQWEWRPWFRTGVRWTALVKLTGSPLTALSRGPALGGKKMQAVHDCSASLTIKARKAGK